MKIMCIFLNKNYAEINEKKTWGYATKAALFSIIFMFALVTDAEKY